MSYELNTLYGYTENSEIKKAIDFLSLKYPNKKFEVHLNNSTFKLTEIN